MEQICAWRSTFKLAHVCVCVRLDGADGAAVVQEVEQVG